MTIIGMWLAVVGYGLAYAGAVSLGGGKCSLIDGFRGQCTSSQVKTKSTTAGGTPLISTVPLQQGTVTV